MRSRLALLSVVIVSGLLTVLLIGQTKVVPSDDLSVSINSSKSEYTLGEVLSLDLEIGNQGDSDVYLHGSDVKSGYLKIFISQDGKIYKGYSSAGWGSAKTKGKTIKAGESIRSRATVLSNTVPDVRNLSATAVRQFEQDQLMTIYAFPEAGDYYIKAILSIPSKEGKRTIESEPIRLSILEPKGEDLEVWNTIKNRADFAYLIQEGEFVDFRKSEAKTKFQQEVEEMIEKYPNSSYARPLRQGLSKAKVSEERLKAYLEKVKH